MRRLAHPLPLQGPLPPDGDGKGRDDREGRRDASTSSSGAPSTGRSPATPASRGSKRVVALARKRSSYGRETVDQIFFQRLTFGRVKSAADFIAAAKTTPQTFNAFYASDSEIASTRRAACRVHRKGVNPDLPVDGRGRNEWRGFLAGSGHPQSVNPPSGLLVNWNNKPAPDFPASDSRFGQEGP